MNNLWTPWRIEHVTGNHPPLEHCLFEPPGTAISNKAMLQLYRDRHVIVLLNKFPYANGHLLIAPTRHVACLTELNDNETAKLHIMVRNATNILKTHMHPDGFNIGANIGSCAGAGIADHLHIHIVPRWNGDHNYITVISEIRTIPEHIEQTFDRLEPDFIQLYHNNQS